MRFGKYLVLSSLLAMAPAGMLRAEDSDVEVLKKQIKELSKKLEDTNAKLASVSSSKTPIAASQVAVDKALDNKYGPDQVVKTNQGKLTMGGLIQVWAYSIQNDNKGLLGTASPTGAAPDYNRQGANDSFTIRRAELSFTMEIQKHVTGYIMADLAGGFAHPALFSPPDVGGYFKLGPNQSSAGGSGSTSNLQDALINFHGIIPHHDMTIGQFLPTFSMEDYGPNSMLDFVERSWVGNHYPRDLGVNIHGSWWDNGGGGPYLGGGDNGRFQYWLSMFNGKGDYHTGYSQNGADDNDAKDFLGTALVRPIWKDTTWGSLELAYSIGIGFHGQNQSTAFGGLGRDENTAWRHSGWFNWQLGGPVRGWWIKAEYAWIKDKQAQNIYGSPVAAVPADLDAFPAPTPAIPAIPGVQADPKAFPAHSWEISTGYNLGNSIWRDKISSWMRGIEFALRYQEYQNVYLPDQINSNHTDVYTSRMTTVGVNYYIKGHNAKVQANYNFANSPDGGSRKFHEVHDDSFMLNFQVMW